MAHATQPHHVPHDQLRTEAPSQRPHSDKYVSAFVSGSATVDMSFRNPVLGKSADHFKVGIDELTVCLGNLSMLEYGTNDVLFRVLRRGRNVPHVNDPAPYEGQPAHPEEHHLNFQMIDGPDPGQGDGSAEALARQAASINMWRDAFEFKIDRPFITILEVLSRAQEVATAVGTHVREQGLVNPANGEGAIWTSPVAAGADALEDSKVFEVGVTTNGQLKFSGNKIFWANFTIEVPKQKYRQIIFKNVDQKYISLHPGSGDEIARPYDTFHAKYAEAVAALEALPANDPNTANLTNVVAYYLNLVQNGSLHNYPLDPVWDGNVGNDLNILGLSFVCDGNLLNTLDRRVTLEVGCSLPVKNSPLVDHGQESPDFVLGRYMFHQPYSMGSGWDVGDVDINQHSLTVPHLGTITVQGPRDRVVYHHLQAQQKIQILRLKLWARVRTYDETTRKWGMKTIVCPVEDIDYWHIRMHFLEK